jgi:RES domain-containing protein
MVSRPDGPLRAFRIADRRHPIFDGAGAYLKGARWTSRGRAVIYAAETYAGALLEMLVHTGMTGIPRTHAWIDIHIPSTVSIEEVRAGEISGWDGDDQSASRAFGDRWHEERRTAVLLVPSVVTNGIERNLILNPEHPAFASISTGTPHDVKWDVRLFD